MDPIRLRAAAAGILISLFAALVAASPAFDLWRGFSIDVLFSLEGAIPPVLLFLVAQQCFCDNNPNPNRKKRPKRLCAKCVVRVGTTSCSASRVRQDVTRTV